MLGPMARYALAAILVAAAVHTSALAQRVPPEVEAALGMWGVPTAMEVRALETRIWSAAGQLDDLVTSGRCRVALPLLEELEGKALLLADLVALGAEPTLLNENWRNNNERGQVQGAARVAASIRASAGYALLDQGRCKVAMGDSIAGTLALLRALDLARGMKDSAGAELAQRLRAELYPLLGLDANAP